MGYDLFSKGNWLLVWSKHFNAVAAKIRYTTNLISLEEKLKKKISEIIIKRYNYIVHQTLHFLPVEPIAGVSVEGAGELAVFPTGVDLGRTGRTLRKDDLLLLLR